MVNMCVRNHDKNIVYVSEIDRYFKIKLPNWTSFRTDSFEHVVWGLLSSNALAHRNLKYSGRWKNFWVCILFEVVTWLLITSFLLYWKFSIFSKSVFSLSCSGVAVYQTACRLRARKKKNIFPKFKFYRFKLSLNFSVSCVCVLCFALFIEGSRLHLYSVLFFGINCGCVPLRWCVLHFTSSTSLTGEDFWVRTVYSHGPILFFE